MRKIYRKEKECTCCWNSLEYNVKANKYRFYDKDALTGDREYSDYFLGNPEDFRSCDGGYINETEEKIKEMFVL